MSEPELLTGLVVAILAAMVAGLVARARTVHASFELGMLRHAHRPWILLVTDSVRVSVALFRMAVLRRPVQGRFRAVRYGATGDARSDVGRRILTEWAASLAPNRYAVGVDRDAHSLLVHELVEAGGPLDPLELG